jgi:hypothetical protein
MRWEDSRPVVQQTIRNKRETRRAQQTPNTVIRRQGRFFLIVANPFLRSCPQTSHKGSGLPHRSELRCLCGPVRATAQMEARAQTTS